MSTDTPTACPSCGGPSAPNHPGGILAGWQHTLACPLLTKEDSRHVADRDMLDQTYGFTRPATATERTLLTALGIVVGEALEVNVSSATNSIVRRDFTDEVETNV